MALSIGIVGLPNVGKSTLFQAITKKQVARENYPFCTIEPNIGTVAVPDKRVDKLAKISASEKIIYSTVKFIDIAGLVKGAHKGEGLGNKFLSHIRETNAIIYILRAFGNDIDILRDKEILDIEMILKDIATIQKRKQSLNKELKSGDKDAESELNVINKLMSFLEKNLIPNLSEFEDSEQSVLRKYQFLCLKPRTYLLNGNKNNISSKVLDKFKSNNWNFLIMDLLTQFELSELTQAERNELGETASLKLDNLINNAYKLLDLITFFTTGQDETRAWTIKKGEKITKAAGVIHSDFEKYFIKAEVIDYKALLKAKGLTQAKSQGLVRTEGKNYVVADGDVIEIKSSA